MIKQIIENILFHIFFSNKCRFGKHTLINKNCVFEGTNVIQKNTEFVNSYLGYASYIGGNCRINNTTIGRYCSIASNVTSVIGNHPTTKFVSTHPAFFSIRNCTKITYMKKNEFEEYRYADNDNKISIIVGNDVWIGESVKIIEGITIGDGAIIAAGAVVTKDVPPYAIVGGVPAKVIRYRFERDEIDYLLNLKWWSKDETWIKINSVYFSNLDLLKKNLNT